VGVRFEIEEAAGFEILHVGAHRSERHSGGGRDIAVIIIEQPGTTQQSEGQLQPGRVQSAEVALPGFDGASLTHDIDEQARCFQIRISGGVDERQAELTAVFRNFARNIRCNQQRRIVQGLALSF